MQGNDDKKCFSVLMHWLSDRMMSAGGVPKEITARLLADYFEALRDIRIERLEWGARFWFSREKWFPMPSEWREAAMQAPSSVLPALPCNQPQICEFSEADIAQAKAEFERIAEEWEYSEVVRVDGCQRPVFGV